MSGIDYTQLDGSTQPTIQKPLHSKLGIASMVLFAICETLFVAGLILIITTKDSPVYDNMALQGIVGLAVMFIALSHFVGGILGFVGMMQKNVRVIWGILGLICNAGAMFFYFILIVIAQLR